MKHHLRKLLIIAVSIAFLLVSIPEFAGAIGLSSGFGGRVLFYVPTPTPAPYVFGIPCPPFVLIDDNQFGTIALIMPAGHLYKFYNPFTPGNNVLGNRSTIPFVCWMPYSFYPWTIMGTSSEPFGAVPVSPK